MKVNELRIGNYVLNDRVHNTIVGILSENIDIVNLKTKQGNIINSDIDFIKPIPLTEDWLLKFGYKIHSENPFCEWWKNESKIVNLKYFIKTGSLEYAVNRLQLKYVHQLQNLYFSLTQKELTIKE